MKYYTGQCCTEDIVQGNVVHDMLYRKSCTGNCWTGDIVQETVGQKILCTNIVLDIVVK